MTASLPDPGARVDVTTSANGCYRTTVALSAPGVLGIFAPPDVPVADLPAIGAPLTAHWYSSRGRHRVDTALVAVSTDGDLVWELEPVAEVQVEQNRNYLRGGGGEAMTLQRLYRPEGPVPGTVVDLGERSVRACFASVEVDPDDAVTLRLELGSDVVELVGTVLRTTSTLERPTEVVVLFDPPEAQATLIRRYNLEGQRRARLQAARA